MRNKLWSLAALALALGGCAAPLPSTELPPTRLVAPAREFPELRDYRGVVDLKLKPAGLDQAAVAQLARDAQLDFVALGDRVTSGPSDYGISGYTSEILFIAGGSFAVGGGEIVGVNLRDAINPPSSASDLISAIHEQGGIAVAGDPSRFASPADYALADALEVYSQSAAWVAKSPTALKLSAMFFSTDRFLAHLDQIDPHDMFAYDRLAAGARVTLLAGFGSAPNMNVFGATVGTYQQLFLFNATHLLATERSVDPLVDAMKHGRAYISFDFLGYVDNFAFYAQNGDARTIMGDETSFAPGLKLRAELPAQADKIVIYGNGSEAASADDATEFEFAPKSAGTYRVIAYRNGCPWIISNPVYIR
ncbi:MAG TPA: hypothetical protein VMA09_15405 [Candidatus Binataceae bacterium]|nr:hypothetical protein [Candidatus Binataceae bacterium]